MAKSKNPPGKAQQKSHYTRLQNAIVKARAELEKLKGVATLEGLAEKLERVRAILNVEHNIAVKAGEKLKKPNAKSAKAVQ